MAGPSSSSATPSLFTSTPASTWTTMQARSPSVSVANALEASSTSASALFQLGNAVLTTRQHLAQFVDKRPQLLPISEASSARERCRSLRSEGGVLANSDHSAPPTPQQLP